MILLKTFGWKYLDGNPSLAHNIIIHNIKSTRLLQDLTITESHLPERGLPSTSLTNPRTRNCHVTPSTNQVLAKQGENKLHYDSIQHYISPYRGASGSRKPIFSGNIAHHLTNIS